MAASGGEHLHLQAALAGRQIDLGCQLLRRDLDAIGVEHRGERGRAALVLALREEGHLLQLDVLVQLRRQRVAQLRRLRREAGTPCEKRAGQQQKNAR